jgi:hypothetical protein
MKSAGAAHTDTDVVVWLPSTNVLIMRDLLTNGSDPVIEESSCGSLGGMIEVIDRLLPLVNAGLRPARIIPTRTEMSVIEAVLA